MEHPHETSHGKAIAPSEPKGDEVVQTLVTLARLHGIHLTPSMLADGAHVSNKEFTLKHIETALATQGIKSAWLPADATHLSGAFCPMAVALPTSQPGAARLLVVTEIHGAMATVIDPVSQRETSMALDELRAFSHVLLVMPTASQTTTVDWLEPPRGANWFWGRLWRHRRTLLEAVLLTTVINVLAVATSVFTMSVYDRVLPNAAFTTLWALAIGVSLAVVFEFAARSIRVYALDRTGKKMDLTLGSTIFRQVLMLRLEKQQGSSSGSTAQMVREYESVRDFVTSLSLTVLADLPFMFLFLGVIAYIGGSLVYVPIAGTLLLMCVLVGMQFPLQRLMSDQMRQGAAKTGLLVESIAALDSIKSLRAEALIVRQHDRLAAEIAQVGLKSRLITNFSANFSTFAQQMCSVALLTWGVYLVTEGKASSGVLVACVMLMGRAMQPMSALAGLAARYQSAKTALQALNKIMSSPREREPGHHYFHRAQWDGHLKLKNVSFAYATGLPQVVHECNLDIQPGEHIGIIGRMGGGKSTMLRLMAGLYQATSGEVVLDGHDLRHVDVSDVRRCIRMLTQDVRLMRGSLLENLRLAAPYASDEVLMQAATAAHVSAFAQAHPLGLNMPVGEGGQMLSRGQRQAVALAQVLLSDARVLLLDEPTASMDQVSEGVIYQALESIGKDRTLVLVTHKGSLLGLVKRLLVVDHGRVVMDGPRDEILRKLAGAVPGATPAARPVARATP